MWVVLKQLHHLSDDVLNAKFLRMIGDVSVLDRTSVSVRWCVVVVEVVCDCIAQVKTQGMNPSLIHRKRKKPEEDLVSAFPPAPFSRKPQEVEVDVALGPAFTRFVWPRCPHLVLFLCVRVFQIV